MRPMRNAPVANGGASADAACHEHLDMTREKQFGSLDRWSRVHMHRLVSKL